MKRPLALLALLTAACGASAQGKANPIGLRVHLSYGTTPSFRADGDSGSSRGPEIGVGLPVGHFLGKELYIEPSVFLGGRLFGESDNDIDVYRLTAYVRHSLTRGLALRAGIGFAVSNGRNGTDGESDVIADLGLEVPFRLKLIQAVDPYLDVHAILSGERQLSGFFVGVGVKV